ncbi:MAG: hypothetical protein NTU89_03380 [Candidatus Dependentiae bacterium]|nr:hypothetical protein [Candidatus Dependentiae bacterium]
MSSAKNACKIAILKLEACALMCEKHVKATASKKDCIQPAKDAIAASKQVIAECRLHIKNCDSAPCKALCSASIKAAEKAVEKCTACIDASGGMGSDSDCMIVCKDCAIACRASLKACKECSEKMCS